MEKMELKDIANDEEPTPIEDEYMQFGEKLVELVRVRDMSSTMVREHGPFTTQEAAQDYKGQHLSKEEGWEVKRVPYKSEDRKMRIIWVIRHAV
jgi:hypothetical protein